jgi:hypothetical protein
VAKKPNMIKPKITVLDEKLSAETETNTTRIAISNPSTAEKTAR